MTEDIPEHIRSETTDMSSFASDDKLMQGKKLAVEYANICATIDRLKQMIEEKTERKLELERREIPEFFDNVLRTDKIGVPEAGVDVVVGPYYMANIKADWPEDQRQRGFDWLAKNGHEDVIAVVVSVKFRRGEFDDAKALEQLIRSSPIGNTHSPVLEMGVPWNTLTSLVREQVEKGETVDLEALGATVGRTAKIKKRK
jgi:hypothetical protein